MLIEKGPVMTQRMFALAVILLAMSTATTACGGGSADEAEVQPTVSPSHDPVQAAKDSAVAAYEAFWKAVAEAGENSDPSYADLEKYGDGDALEKVTKMLEGYVEAGHITHGEPDVDPTATDATPAEDPAKVTLTDCADTTGYLVYDKKTDKIVDTDRGGQRAAEAVVEHIDGDWKVTAFGIGALGSC